MWPFKPALASLAALALLPWAAGAALGPRYGGELTVGVVELPDSLDPDLPRGAGQSLLAGLVHETLVGCGPDGVPVPRLARSWASSGGGREWTLRLADGSAFHDGKPMTATDVVRSLRRFLRSGSPAAQRFAETLEGGLAYRTRGSEEVGGLLAVDDSRLTLRLAEAVPLPFAPLSATAAAITSASGAGAGPFAPTAFLPGKSRLFTAFGAHLAGRPYLDQVQLLASPEPQSAEAALQAGRAGLIPRIGNTPRSYLGGTLLLILDPDHPPFDRLPARSAVAATLEVAQRTAENRSSMLQDVERGRPTEIEALNGAVVREGLALGIPTPVNALLLERIRRLTTGPLSENALPSLVGQP